METPAPTPKPRLAKDFLAAVHSAALRIFGVQVAQRTRGDRFAMALSRTLEDP